MSVFAGPHDFTLKPTGEGAGTGLNIWGDPEYGTFDTTSQAASDR